MEAVPLPAEGQGVVVGAVDGYQVAPAPAAFLPPADAEGVATYDDGRAPVRVIKLFFVVTDASGK